MNYRINYFKRTDLGDSKQFVLCLFGVTCWASLNSKDIFWFRLFGVGFMFKNKKLPPRFSQRYRYVKTLEIGKYRIEYLPYR